MSESGHRDADDPCPVGMRGIVPSLNTPFLADGEVDEASVRRLVEATLAAGCAGILAIAVAGEQASLSFAEKDRLVRIIVESAGGRIPVIASVTSLETETSQRLARMARSGGAACISCQAPAGLTGPALVDYFSAIAAAGPETLMIQDLDWSGPGLAIDDINRLFEAVEPFRCLKIETVPAGPKYSAVLKATGGRLHVSGGWAVREMIDALERGVHAFMPTAMDSVYCAIYEAFRSGDRNRARRLFEKLKPVVAFSNQEIDVSIRFFKMLRHAEGLFDTQQCRQMVRPLDEKERQDARRWVDYALTLRSELIGA